MGDPLKFLDTMSHDLAMAAAEEEASKPAPVATPTPDLDPAAVRRALEHLDCAPSRFPIRAAAREWLRLREQQDDHDAEVYKQGWEAGQAAASVGVRTSEQPAPKGQAQDEFRFGPCVRCGEKDIAWPQHDGAPIVCCDCQHYERGLADGKADLDAAVERERGRVIGIFVGELQKLHEKTVLDCGDNSCLFATRRGGMRTNGGCRCIERLLDAAVAREREECARIAEQVWDSGNQGAHGGEQANRTAAAIRARSAKGV